MKWLYRLENVTSGILILLVTAVLFINVILRFVFSSSLSWSEELIRYGFIWITFIGGAICVRTASHVKIDLIPNYLSENGKRILLIFTSFVALLFLVWLGKLGIDLVAFNYETGQKSPSLGIPIYYVYLAIPVGNL